MKVVVMKQKGNRPIEDRWKRLSHKAEVMEWDNVNTLVSWLSGKNYELALIVTRESSIPDLQEVRAVSEERPLVVFCGMDERDEAVLVAFIESYMLSLTPVYDNDRFAESLRYIDDHLFDQGLSLDQVASRIYVSRSYYSRLFQKHVGIGFKKYIIQKRMEKAKLLLMSGRPVTDVCFSVGYNDLTHFGRVFKKVVGTNPSAWRNENLTMNGGMR